MVALHQNGRRTLYRQYTGRAVRREAFGNVRRISVTIRRSVPSLSLWSRQRCQSVLMSGKTGAYRHPAIGSTFAGMPLQVLKALTRTQSACVYDNSIHEELLLGGHFVWFTAVQLPPRGAYQFAGESDLIESWAVHDGHAPQPGGFTYAMLYIPQRWMADSLDKRGMGDISTGSRPPYADRRSPIDHGHLVAGLCRHSSGGAAGVR